MITLGSEKSIFFHFFGTEILLSNILIYTKRMFVSQFILTPFFLFSIIFSTKNFAKRKKKRKSMDGRANPKVDGTERTADAAEYRNSVKIHDAAETAEPDRKIFGV